MESHVFFVQLQSVKLLVLSRDGRDAEQGRTGDYGSQDLMFMAPGDRLGSHPYFWNIPEG